MLRTLAGSLSRNLVYRRRMPANFGRRSLYVTPDSALAYLKPGFAAFRDLFQIASKFIGQGDCVWDVGANVGLFSLLAADRCGSDGSVISIEADPILAALVQRSARLRTNSDLKWQVLCAAAAESNEVAAFSIAARGRSSNSLEQSGHRSQAGGTRYTQLVATVSLDSLLTLLPPPTFLKIDVEGAEASVLRGAKVLLLEHRPALYVEVGPGWSASVSELLSDFGYEFYDGSRPLTDQSPSARTYFNTLALPKTAAQSFEDRAAA